MDGEKHLFASPRHFATIRIDPGNVGRWGDVHPTLRVFMMLKGIPGKPRPVRFGEFRGLHGGHVNEKGRRINLWCLGAGRLLIMIEFQSSSSTSTIAVAEEVLSSLAVEHAAVDAHPLERDVYGHAGRVVGTAIGYLWKYRHPLVLLVLAALLILMGGGRL